MPEGRRKDPRERSEVAENCSGHQPTATTLNMFKVVAEVRRFHGVLIKDVARDAVETQ
ncbi:hypothetical protein DPMN_036434 [Dreissena polymorpha]|uniref:Uncharacterized protein n=1 Tax=Dreissena polymorpha TaxID=45954 RepID=A0A9D4MBI3_DREPO|nr:hypothetical protein DPMN_036434 [Dreissena polymorpha]